MSRAAQYAAAMLPDPWRVAGVRLIAPTLGHTLLLERLGLPATASAVQGVLPAGTMVLWLFVLSRPWHVAAASIKTWRARWWMRVAGWQLSRRSNEQQAIAMATYLAEAWSGPEIWEKGESSREVCAPLMQRLKLLLMSKLGLTEAAALATPVRVALWDAAALGEETGALEWVNESTEAAIADGLQSLAEGGGKQHEEQAWHEQAQPAAHQPQGHPPNHAEAPPHGGSIVADR